MAQYYPQSQIKTNLITSGNEYMIKSSGIPYTGFYYKTSIGKKYTGKTPQDGGNYELVLQSTGVVEPSLQGNEIEFTDNWDGGESYISPDGPIINEEYNDSIGMGRTLPPPRFLPSYNSPKPTEKDYTIEEFQRYFCKKNNQLIYLEIDKDTSTKLSNQDPTIAFDLYSPISTPWTIAGDKTSVYNTNKQIITLIERNQKWYGFTNYFQDKFSEYYLEE